MILPKMTFGHCLTIVSLRRPSVFKPQSGLVTPRLAGSPTVAAKEKSNDRANRQPPRPSRTIPAWGLIARAFFIKGWARAFDDGHAEYLENLVKTSRFATVKMTPAYEFHSILLSN
jgi:hypothetical protein